MYRFCALIAKPSHRTHYTSLIEHASLALRKKGYNCVFRTPYAEIFASIPPSSPLKIYPIEPEYGVILGTIFSRSQSGDINKINNIPELATSSTFSNIILSNYWGRYIAFFLTHDGVSVLRDPTGGLPCYYYEHDTAHCFFSDALDFTTLNLMPISIDWQYVAGHLINPAASLKGSGLAGVRQIAPGSQYHIGPNEIAYYKVWNEEKIALSSPIQSVDDAATLLRDAVLYSVQSWGQAYRRFLLMLSGGLDSSIIIGSLKGAVETDNVFCINYHSGTADSDERYYAKLAADDFGAELIEVNETPDNITINDLEEFRFSAEPVMILDALMRSRVRSEISAQHNVNAIFIGRNGDGIFGKDLERSVTDYLFMNRPNIAFLKYAYNSARIAHENIWKIIYNSILDRLFKRQIFIHNALSEKELIHRKNIFPHYTGTFGDQFIPSSTLFPPQKRFHIENTLVTNSCYYPDRPQYQLEWVSPLISQPVLEAVYRIPTYLMTYAGRSRGLARLAFSNIVPTKIIYRETKAAIQDLTDRIFIKNMSFLKDYYMDGVLVQHGLLNKKAVEQAFLSGYGEGGMMRTTLLASLGAEAWSRQWQSLTTTKNI